MSNEIKNIMGAVSKPAVPNKNPETGFYYGVISFNNIDLEYFNDFLLEATPVYLSEYLASIESSKENIILEMENMRSLSVGDYASDEVRASAEQSFTELSEALDAFISEMEEAFNIATECCGSTASTYSDEEYEFIIHETEVMVIKSPWVKYVSPCSPCYPNAGDLTAGDSGNAMGGPRWTYSLHPDGFCIPSHREGVILIKDKK